LLVELLLFLAAVLWTMRTLRKVRGAQDVRLPGQRTVRIANLLFGMLAAAALFANMNGQVRLAGMIGGSVILSSYLAIVIYTSMRVIDGLFQAAACVPPLSLLDMVKRKKSVLISHFQRWLRWAAYASWIALTLASLGLLHPLLALLKDAWAKTLPIGTFTPTTGDVVTFILIIWATFGLSRLTRFILEEEAYPKLQLERGLPYAISTVVHYMVLLTGFVLALNALKVDMTKFTILAGALSVGIGFGLQNIVNNFVSGLIVLFERPVKVGDTIQMDDVVGRVKYIGIRASVIASTTGAEVIIPNGKLISERVTNWTLSSKLRQVMITVTTKASYDAVEIRQLLLDIAQRNALVADKPPPEAWFVKRTIDQAEFELHVWTAALDEWMSLKSALMSEINEALRNKDAAA
ncbi:MAG: mechanosensitive ion channel family protein, partial [Burkholderiaceae bacterium]